MKKLILIGIVALVVFMILKALLVIVSKLQNNGNFLCTY